MTYFRCNQCFQAAARLDRAAEADPKKKKALQTLKRTDREEWRVQVVKMRNQHQRHQRDGGAVTYLDTLSTKVSQYIQDRAVILNRDQWIENCLDTTQMTPDQAALDFLRACDSGDYQVCQHQGQKCLIKLLAPMVMQERGQHWERSLGRTPPRPRRRDSRCVPKS